VARKARRNTKILRRRCTIRSGCVSNRLSRWNVDGTEPRLDVDQRGAVETVDRIDTDRAGRGIQRCDPHGAQGHRVGPHRRAQRKCAARPIDVAGALHDQIASSPVHPIEQDHRLSDRQTLEATAELWPQLNTRGLAGFTRAPDVPGTISRPPWAADPADEFQSRAVTGTGGECQQLFAGAGWFHVRSHRRRFSSSTRRGASPRRSTRASVR